MKEYYDRRAPEYDDWYLGRGAFTGRDRPGWDEEVSAVVSTIESLRPGRTLDVACGTGFLTRHLRGAVVALDQSARMLSRAATQAPRATLVQGDGLALPFPNDSFDRVFTAHFYGHLDPDERARFLAEVDRVARELVVVDASRGASDVREEMQTRVLDDGSEWQVLKRWFTGAGLLEELGGGEVLHEGRWFVVARSPR
jgi:ubiquinone/menaquinone biosynthesis C-methylase UbiE